MIKIKLEKMRNLYYIEIGAENIPCGYTLAARGQQYIVSANTSKEAEEIIEDGFKATFSSTKDYTEFNFKFKANKIGLTNKKKGVMFSWIC